VHDFVLAGEIADVALRTASENGGGRIRRVHVTLARGSHIDPDTLGGAFAMAVSGTAAEGAVLVITHPPAGSHGELAVLAVDVEEPSDP